MAKKIGRRKKRGQPAGRTTNFSGRPKRKFQWDRLPRETAKSFAAFCRYILMPTEIRTIDKVRVAVGKDKGKNIETITFWQWSRKNDWVKRAKSYDEYMLMKERAEHEKLRMRMNKRHAKEAMKKQELLNVYDRAANRKLEKDSELELKYLEALPLEALIDKIAEHIPHIEKLVTIERRARGASDKNIAIKGEVKHDVVVEDKLEKHKKKMEEIEKRIEDGEYK